MKRLSFYIVALIYLSIFVKSCELENLITLEPPTAAFRADTNSIIVGDSVQFTDESSNNPAIWNWDFGDGSISSEQNPAHKYILAGKYTVKLIANNDAGADTVVKVNLIAVNNITDTLTDLRDGKIYRTVKIGDQWWMAENLAYLPSVSPASVEIDETPLYYIYDFNSHSITDALQDSNYLHYGTLYNWDAALISCPEGWHLPSDYEWYELFEYLGGEDVAGGEMKEEGYTHWLEPNKGATNSSGFGALPGGYRYWEFHNINSMGYYWTSTSTYFSTAHQVKFSFFDTEADIGSNSRSHGCSVRCLKD